MATMFAVVVGHDHGHTKAACVDFDLTVFLPAVDCT